MEGPLGWGRQEVDGWRKGPWTSQEDQLLVDHVRQHGEGRWNSVSKITGLKRSGKSCRLRWVNYLRPDLKRGKITPQEESIIVRLHALWGNRWSTIARSLPGRTDNEIKNYWRTHFKKGKPSKNIERARARFLKQRQEMQSQKQQLQQEEEMQSSLGQAVGGNKDEFQRACAVAAAADEDRGSAVVGDACAARTVADEAAAAGQQHQHEDLIMHADVAMDFLCPMSCALLLHDGVHQLGGGGPGSGGSCCGSTSEEYGSSEDDGATWGSLWNLDGVVVDDATGGCALW